MDSLFEVAFAILLKISDYQASQVLHSTWSGDQQFGHCQNIYGQIKIVKFIYSEKATKFFEIFTLLLTGIILMFFDHLTSHYLKDPPSCWQFKYDSMYILTPNWSAYVRAERKRKSKKKNIWVLLMQLLFRYQVENLWASLSKFW